MLSRGLKIKNGIIPAIIFNIILAFPLYAAVLSFVWERKVVEFNDYIRNSLIFLAADFIVLDYLILPIIVTLWNCVCKRNK